MYRCTSTARYTKPVSLTSFSAASASATNALRFSASVAVHFERIDHSRMTRLAGGFRLWRNSLPEVFGELQRRRRGNVRSLRDPITVTLRAVTSARNATTSA